MDETTEQATNRQPEPDAATLGFGIAGILFCWVPLLGLVLNGLALMNRKQRPRHTTTAVGVALGGIGMVVAVLVTIGLGIAAIGEALGGDSDSSPYSRY